MRVLGCTWAGVRTSDLKSTARFFAEALGLSVSYEGKGLVQFEMPSGQLFEIFSSGNRYYHLHTCPVLAFQVEDVRRARMELASRGVQFETDVEGNESEAWTYFAAQTATCTNFGKPLALSRHCCRVNECYGDFTPTTMVTPFVESRQ